MKNITYTEIQKAARELESDILKSITQFTEKTGLHPQIDIQKVTTSGMDGTDVLLRYNVDIKDAL